MAKLKLVKEKATFKPLQSGPEARIQKRRASQAKHRHNLAACFKNLHGVLPEEDITKLRTPGQSRPDILQDAFSGIKTNRTMLLSRAKNYVLHLESVVTMLMAEKNKFKHNAFPHGMQSTQFLRMSNNGNSQFRSIKDVRRSFLSNFELEKSIDDYTFCRLEETDEGESQTMSGLKKNDPCLHGHPSQSSLSQPTLNSNAISTDVNPLLLIPINVQSMFDNAPVYVSATSPSLLGPRSPTDISVDLGFVSAENASQETPDASLHAI